MEIRDHFTGQLKKDLLKQYEDPPVFQAEYIAPYYSNYRKVRKHREPLNEIICRVKEIDWTTQTQERAGVIVYRKNADRSMEFVLGVDINYGSLTDFAGGVKTRDMTVVHAAMREFLEETYGAFKFDISKPLSNPIVLNSWVLLTDQMAIIFLPLDYQKETVITRYNYLYLRAKYHETKSLVFMDTREFRECIETGSPDIFHPVRDSIITVLPELLNKL